MIAKTDLKDNGSDYYREKFLYFPTTEYVLDREDIYDPGRVMFKIGYPFSAWNLILRINNIIDPLSLEVGQKIRIPDRRDLQEL